MTGGNVSPIETIKNRRDFLEAGARGKKCVTGTLILQGSPRSAAHPADKSAARIGYTVTKKMGNAVARNRIKRRLREAVRRIAPQAVESGHDYVLIARSKALTCDFSVILRDMEFAFSRITANKNQ
jgi:ribonuclease P protein component